MTRFSESQRNSAVQIKSEEASAKMLLASRAMLMKAQGLKPFDFEQYDSSKGLNLHSPEKLWARVVELETRLVALVCLLERTGFLDSLVFDEEACELVKDAADIYLTQGIKRHESQ